MIQKYILILLLIAVTSPMLAQIQQSDSKSDTIDEKRIDLSLMPYLSYNRNLKLILGLIPMAMYKLNPDDDISPKSLSGVAAAYTTNGSRFIGFFNRLYFAEDKWRITFFGGTGDHYSQFFMDHAEFPGFYEFGTETTIISAGVQRKITQGLYGGFTYTYANHLTTFEDDIRPESRTETHALEYSLALDLRDDVYYPNTGSLAKVRWKSFPDWIGNEVNADKILAEYNHYFSVRNQSDVVAARIAGNFGLGNIAFEQQVTISGTDIRGYSEGKYRGDGLLALQGEYRYNLKNRMGLVGFAGLATIYGSDTPDFNWDLYPGIGVGYRYRAFKTVKFNIGLDAAFGKDDWGIYFRIGEAF